MSAIVAIPARLESTRFPRKVLAEIQGNPMLWHVWNNASKCQEISGVWIFTDADEIKQTSESWGANTMMTSKFCVSGTDRIASVIHKFETEIDIIVNLQADEPLIDYRVIDKLILSLKTSRCDVATPVYKIDNSEDLNNPNIVKVVKDHSELALYFSRNPIPYIRDVGQNVWVETTQYWGHPGIYAYRRQTLIDYSNLPAGQLEQLEKLEQLRLLEAGLCIQTVEVDYKPYAVDTPDDLNKVLSILESQRK